MLTSVLSTLEEILGILTDPELGQDPGCLLNPGVCRIVLAPGQEVAWDSCSSCGSVDGQLWAAIQPLMITPQGAGCDRVVWTAEIGVVRCAAQMKDDGRPPEVSDVETNAWQQALDADTISRAIRCCFNKQPDTVQPIDMVSWTPLGPQGDCVGGSWTIRGVLDDCC